MDDLAKKLVEICQASMVHAFQEENDLLPTLIVVFENCQRVSDFRKGEGCLVQGSNNSEHAIEELIVIAGTSIGNLVNKNPKIAITIGRLYDDKSECEKAMIHVYNIKTKETTAYIYTVQKEGNKIVKLILDDKSEYENLFKGVSKEIEFNLALEA